LTHPLPDPIEYTEDEQDVLHELTRAAWEEREREEESLRLSWQDGDLDPSGIAGLESQANVAP